MTKTAKRRSLIDRIRRIYRISRRYAARYDSRWLDACFAWGWLDH